MTRGRRTIRLAKWAGVGLCVLIIATWAVSMRWAFGYFAPPIFYRLIESGVFFAVEDSALRSLRGQPERFEWFLRSADPRPQSNRTGYTTVYIPLWLPLAVLALPTAWLFWLDRRKPRPGFCECGFDLTGNVSGVCPECGTGFGRGG